MDAGCRMLPRHTQHFGFCAFRFTPLAPPPLAPLRSRFLRNTTFCVRFVGCGGVGVAYAALFAAAFNIARRIMLK